MSSPTSEEDEALSAALGWPGGISEPLLDRVALLRLVASAAVELASMRRCFEAADRERSELRERAERADAQRDALRAELREATEAIDDPAVNNLRTLPDSIRMLRAENDVLRAALELYRGQVDQTGRHSAADAIKRAAQALGARETPRAAEVLQKPLD